VNGTPIVSDEPVVALVRRRTACEAAPTPTCTGVLVGPRLVVTAAHCVERARPGGLEVFHGADVTGQGAFVVVSEIRTHPAYDPETGELDVALLVLAEPSPIAPIALPVQTLEMASGPLRAVGFGVTARGADDAGVKREGTLALGATRTNSFDASAAPSMTCDVDSGGPVFANGQLAGLTVRGDLSCTTSAFQVRADRVLDFIMPAIAESSAAPIATRDDFPAVGEGTLGAACTTDADCGSAMCARLWPNECGCFSPNVTAPPDDSSGSCQVCDADGVALLVALGWLARRLTA
jgi:secreted trypsin-like serine protease